MPVGSLNLSTLRLTGLSSGLDTDSIVKSLLEIDQMKVDKQFKYQTKLEWKGEALREINTLLKNFRQENLSVLKPATNMLSTDTYNAYKVTMLNESSAVTVTAGSSAAVGQTTINSITQLAAPASMKSASVFNGVITTSATLSELDFVNDLVFDTGQITFSINGEEFAFGEATTLADMISQVNASDAGVTMRYSSLSNGFTITSKDTGSASSVEIVNISGNAFAAVNSAFGIAEGSASGQDAMLSIDNIAVTKPTNAFTIDGITYSLKNTSPAAVSFNVERDIDNAFDKIVSFIGNYNTLISALQSKIDEAAYASYEPLTDAEKEPLSESQITKWEEKAKSGLLKNDSNIKSLLGAMRNAFYTTVEGAGISAFNIGITTQNYASNGEITINEDALREALQDNPDQVISLFTDTSQATDATTKYNQSGLVTRISNALLVYTDNSTDITLANLGTEIYRAESKMSRLQDWLETQEENYYRKFSAMESALASLNNQSSWLSSMVASWSSSS
ncbi:MAG: flagellar filament capping protein FliD [Christensenellales bacterium]